MNTGKLFVPITIKTSSVSLSSGDVTETWSEGVIVRAKVTQIDGSRFLKDNELADRIVYQVELWDNDYDNNIQITMGDLILYPIRPWTKGYDSSLRTVAKILVATKI